MDLSYSVSSKSWSSPIIARMDTSGSPVPDAFLPYFKQLREYLKLQSKYRPHLQLAAVELDVVTAMDTRDGLAHVLRCLKVWFDMPSEVFFAAMTMMDLFLTKMICQPKYMPCISVAAFHLATEYYAKPIDLERLVKISQVKCTERDVRRMSDLITSKLNWEPQVLPVNAMTFLKHFYNMLRAAASRVGLQDIFDAVILESQLIQRLEVIICDGKCANVRSSEIAIVLMCAYLDEVLSNRSELNKFSDKLKTDANRQKKLELIRLVDFACVIQDFCKISDDNFVITHEMVYGILCRYNAQVYIPQRQNLIWKMSSRTAAVFKPTARFKTKLPAIEEHVPVPSPSKMSRKSQKRKFSRRQGRRR